MMTDTLWRDWTVEQWMNHEAYCEACGLPLIEIDGGYRCVYCTWLEDHNVIKSAMISHNKSMNKHVADLEKELSATKRRTLQLYGALEGARRIASEYYAFGLTGFEGDYAQIANQLKDEPDWEDK